MNTEFIQSKEHLDKKYKKSKSKLHASTCTCIATSLNL